MAEKDDINKLTDLRTAKVSLVRRGANKRTFAVRKAEEDAMDETSLEQVNEIVRSTEAAIEKSMPEEFKKALSEGALNALKVAMRAVNGYAEEPGMKTVLAAIEAATKMKPGDEYPMPKKAQNGKPNGDMCPPYPKPTATAKDFEGMTPEQQKRVEDAIQKSHDAAAERIAKAEEKAAEVAKALEDERNLRLEREFIAKAEKEYPSIPGKPSELGLVLKSLHAKAPEDAAKIEAMLTSVEALIAKSALLGEAGKSGSNDRPDSALGEMTQRAEATKQ